MLLRYFSLLCLFAYFIPVLHLSGQTAENSCYKNAYNHGYSTPSHVLLPMESGFADRTTLNRILKTADSLRSLSPDIAKKMAESALLQSRRIQYQPGIVYALYVLGRSLQEQGKHDSAILYFKEALPVALKESNKRRIYKLHLRVSESYFMLGKYDLYLDEALNALAAIEKGNEEFTYADSVALYANIGYVWTRLDGVSQAFSVLKTAREIAERANDTVRLAAVYARIGMAYLEQGDVETAEAYYLKGLQGARQYNQIGSQIEILNTLSHFYIDQEDLVEARTYTDMALKLLDRYPGQYQYDRFHARHNLGCVYLHKQAYEKAESILLPTLKEAEAIQQKDMIPHMETDIATLYAETGRYQLAYEHMLRYARIKDTIFDQQRLRSLEMWERSRTSEREKAMMAQQLRIARQERQLQKKNFWIGGTTLGSLLLLTTLFGFWRSYQHKQKVQTATLQQLKQEQEINQLKAQVRGEEQERNRIATELHDGIASQLWAIKLNVDNLKQQEVLSEEHRQNLNSIYQQLDDTTQEVRKTAHNLMPDLLLEEGLGAALASLCEKIKKQTHLEVDFLEYGPIPRMHEDIELSLYRMVQELVQNVLKHASEATQLLVQLSCINSILNITVEDNGIGLKDTQEFLAEKGIGLRQIEKRVQALQGQFDLQSSEGQGTMVYLEFEIKHLL